MLRAACERSVPHPLGEALFHQALEHVWVLNQLIVDTDVDAAGLMTALDDLYAKMAHRRAFVGRADVGERLAPQMRAAGWQTERDVFLILRRDRDRPPAPGLGARGRRAGDPRRRGPDDRRALAPRRAGGRPAAAVALGVRRGPAARAISSARPTASTRCHATLYSDGVIAQVEDVGTIDGLARPRPGPRGLLARHWTPRSRPGTS